MIARVIARRVYLAYQASPVAFPRQIRASTANIKDETEVTLFNSYEGRQDTFMGSRNTQTHERRVNIVRTTQLCAGCLVTDLILNKTKDWNSDAVSAAPGDIVGESEHAASLLCKGAEDFEGK